MYSQQYSNKHNLKNKHLAAKALSSNTISSSFFEDNDEDAELLYRLESIEQEMLAGAGVTFNGIENYEREYNQEFVEEMNEIKNETPVSFAEYGDLFDDELESIIGIAQADYTDDVTQLKKDSRRF